MPENRRSSLAAWISRPESIIGICAVIVSVVAVSISAYEAGLQRDWQRAAVWPYIQLNRSYYCKASSVAPGGCEWILTLNAENVGVGPAHVRDFHVVVDGKPQATWRAAMQALLHTNEDVQYGQSTILGTIVPPQRTIQMFQYIDSARAEKLFKEMDRLTYSACFCSVFDECWVTNSKETHAEKISRCTTDKNSFTE